MMIKSEVLLHAVIPAQAGIQFFQCIVRKMDTGLRRYDDFLRSSHGCADYSRLLTTAACPLIP